MNHQRIGLGLAASFLGIVVPVGHHAALYMAIAGHPTNNDITVMDAVFRYLPWIDWVYWVTMTLVGLILITSGMLACRSVAAADKRP